MAIAARGSAAGVELVQSLEAYGSSVDERSDLVALAGVESNWNWDAVGDEGRSHGIWQTERAPGVDRARQVEHAVTLYRSIIDAMQGLRSLNDQIAKRRSGGAVAVRLDGADRLRLVRAAWQLPQPAQALKDWAAHLRPIVAKVSSRDDDPDWAAINDGAGLPVQSFIDWYCAANPRANKAALERGQKTLEAFGRATGWDWLRWFTPPTSAATDAFRTPAVGTPPSILDWAGQGATAALGGIGSIADAIGRGIQGGVRGIGTVIEYALPVAMVGIPLLLAGRWLLSRQTQTAGRRRAAA